jgi:hypothetical protein
MSEQEQMDDLIRSKFSEERDFPFDEENWAKAEEMIIDQRNKEKRKRWGIIFFSGIIIGALVMIPFVIQKDGNTKFVAKGEKKQIAGNKNTVSITSGPNEKNSNKQTATENESQDTSTVTSEEKSNSLNVTEEKREEKRATIVAETKVVEQKVIRKPVFSSISDNREKTKKAAVENKKSKTIKEPVTINKEKKTETSKVTAKSNWYFYNKTVKEQGAIDFNKREGRNRKNEDNWRRSSKAQTNSMAIVPTAKENQKNTGTTQTVSDKANEVKENSTAVASMTTTSVNSNENNVVQQNTTEPVSKDSSKTEPVIVKKDTTPVVVTPPVQKDSISKPKSTWTVSLDLGVNTFLSGGSGVSPFGGINITKSFTPKWEIGTGIYYTYLPTYSSSSTFTTSTVYDFGYNFKLTEIVTDKLHYMTAPLFLKYNLNEKNSIVLGANFYYLFNSSNIITTYDLSYSGIQNKVSKKTSGYYNGFSDYDVGIMAGYRKNLFEKFGLAIYINYGLINIQKAGTVNSINMHNNISGQIMLTYKLFK